MFAAKNLLLSRRTTAILTATSSTNVTITPASFSGYVAGNSDVTYQIPAGVVIGSTTIASYALTFSGFNARDKIIIENYGTIAGRGGDGNSGAGGPALNVASSGASVIINNRSGAIIGSGGGAGGSGAGASIGPFDQSYNGGPSSVLSRAKGGGGGGGQGFTGGTGGAVVGVTANYWNPGSGHPANAAAGGAGSISSFGTGGVYQGGFATATNTPSPFAYFRAGSGGNGGSFGSNGSAGGNGDWSGEAASGSPGPLGSTNNALGGPTAQNPTLTAGGTTGNAIKGVGVYTLNNYGNVYGPQIP